MMEFSDYLEPPVLLEHPGKMAPMVLLGHPAKMAPSEPPARLVLPAALAQRVGSEWWAALASMELVTRGPLAPRVRWVLRGLKDSQAPQAR